MKTAVFLLSLTFALPGQTPTKKPGRVEGVVTSSVNGEAVKKATVTLQNTTQQFAYATSSDGNGHFVFDHVEPGSYTVTADRAGYIAADMGNRKRLQVEEDQTAKDVEMKLVRLGTISGHILDEDGDPVIGAQVRALRYNYSQAKRRLNPQGAVSTNDLGEYQVTDLQPGRYYIVASASLGRMNLPTSTRHHLPEEAYQTTYYPSGTDVGQASASDLAAGGHVSSIDLRLRKVRSFHIRGKVVDGQTGQGVSNVGIDVIPPEGAVNRIPVFARVQRDGSFDAQGIPAGSYVVVCQRNEGNITATARQSVNIVDQDAEVLLTLSPGLEIPGLVQFEGSAPTGQVNVHVTLQGPERSAAASNIAWPDGTFAFNNIAPDVYHVAVSAYVPCWYVKSIRFGDREVPGGQIDLTQQTSGTLSISFAADGGQIQGTVLDRNGQPAAGAIITIAPSDGLEGRSDLFKVSGTVKDGSFTIRDVAPGSYRVFAWERSDFSMLQSPEFRKLFESQSSTVSVGSNAHESIQLKAIPAEEIEAAKSKMP